MELNHWKVWKGILARWFTFTLLSVFFSLIYTFDFEVIGLPFLLSFLSFPLISLTAYLAELKFIKFSFWVHLIVTASWLIFFLIIYVMAVNKHATNVAEDLSIFILAVSLPSLLYDFFKINFSFKIRSVFF